METIEQIEQAIERLAPDDFVRLAAWVAARHHDEWTEQIGRDARAGKLDFLFAEAENEREKGQLRDWPGQAS